ncbi:hypothetical protein chiPu_0008392 [Chiloscyllium punctatum]|uniref:Uncharacterized protein n=1 Tax=Chiloscyllium punctatum TaxID=137246 RepID=A0A401SHS3_CHIPU|nr:hypothetical protein [Chiloscyllium punctatum]
MTAGQRGGNEHPAGDRRGCCKLQAARGSPPPRDAPSAAPLPAAPPLGARLPSLQPSPWFNFQGVGVSGAGASVCSPGLSV